VKDDAFAAEENKKYIAFTLDRIKARDAHALELTKFTSQWEIYVGNACIILNATAIISSLTFIGNVVVRSQGGDPSIPRASVGDFYTAISAWCVGLVVGIGAAALGYYSQRRFMKAKRREIDAIEANWQRNWIKEGEAKADRDEEDLAGRIAQSTMHWAALLSVVAFLVGVTIALRGLQRLVA
jgi:hypothetical protein